MQKYRFKQNELKSFLSEFISDKAVLKDAMKEAKKYIRNTVGDEYEVLIDDIPVAALINEGYIFLNNDEEIDSAKEAFLDKMCDQIKEMCNFDLELYENFRGNGWNGKICIAEEDYSEIWNHLHDKYPMVTLNRL